MTPDLHEDFLPEDYAFTFELLHKYSRGPDANPTLFQAVCSNNLNIILAALTTCSTENPPK